MAKKENGERLMTSKQEVYVQVYTAAVKGWLSNSSVYTYLSANYEVIRTAHEIADNIAKKAEVEWAKT